jgi:hypothetical protein
VKQLVYLEQRDRSTRKDRFRCDYRSISDEPSAAVNLPNNLVRQATYCDSKGLRLQAIYSTETTVELVCLGTGFASHTAIPCLIMTGNARQVSSLVLFVLLCGKLIGQAIFVLSKKKSHPQYFQKASKHAPAHFW